ncbi:hypothetical protein C8F01DRAFT_1255915 [Mycena amicta]|nr:hypothetical protein C8F01DRAFT_1255915 [Mycena amicta]
MSDQLKTAGNALFASKEYKEAAEKYSAALALDPLQNHILYANRAACYHALGRSKDGLVDAKKAIELDPSYSKGWFRRGACEDALGNIPESIEAYQTALSTTPSIAQRSEIQKSISSIDFLRAMARAHDMPLPPGSPTRDALYNVVSRHPSFGTEPKLRLLFFPQSPMEPLKQIELVRGPDILEKISKLLGCRLVDCVVLHSEEQLALAQKKPYGVGIGRLHETYELWMDDMAVYQRPLNERASRILKRPETYGPVLLQKTTLIKRSADPVGHSEDIISFDRVTEQELASEEYKNRRDEWVRYMGTGDAPNLALYQQQSSK